MTEKLWEIYVEGDHDRDSIIKSELKATEVVDFLTKELICNTTGYYYWEFIHGYVRIRPAEDYSVQEFISRFGG